jgi:hypothetical protein
VYQQASDRSAWFAWRALEEQGWKPVAHGGQITLFGRGSSSAPPPFAEPARTEPVFCQGWRDGATTELQAPFWLYGRGPFTLTFTAAAPTHVELSSADWPATQVVDVKDEPVTAQGVTFDSDGWHAVVLDASSPGVHLEIR